LDILHAISKLSHEQQSHWIFNTPSQSNIPNQAVARRWKMNQIKCGAAAVHPIPSSSNRQQSVPRCQITSAGACCVARYWKTGADGSQLRPFGSPIFHHGCHGRSISDVSGVVCAARPIDNYRTPAHQV
jgi:hypothetical protein